MKFLYRWNFIFFLCWPALSSSQSAQAFERSAELKKYCIENIKQRTAALVAEDWNRLIAEANNYIRRCEKAFSSEDFANAYEQRAIGFNRLGQPNQSLQAVEFCLNIDYANTGCHINQAEALQLQGKFQDSLKSLDRADRLLTFSLQRLEREIQRPQDSQSKELAQSRYNEKLAQQRASASLRQWMDEIMKTLRPN